MYKHNQLHCCCTLWHFSEVFSEWQKFACKYYRLISLFSCILPDLCVFTILLDWNWIWVESTGQWVSAVCEKYWVTDFNYDFFFLHSLSQLTFGKALDISITAAQPIFEEANHFQNITSFIYTDNAMIVAILVLYTSMTALEHTSVN